MLSSSPTVLSRRNQEKDEMRANLRIAVADDELDMREYLQEMLPLMGHRVVAVATDGEQLVKQCLDLRPDLVITDIKMPRLDGIEAGLQIHRKCPAPVILVSAHHEADLLERAEAGHILAYLVKPVKQADLESAIRLVMRRFEQLQTLQREADSLRQALEDRKVIERAKGLVMKQTNLDEDAAFRRLQQLARANNQKLVDIARSVIIASEAMQMVDDS